MLESTSSTISKFVVDTIPTVTLTPDPVAPIGLARRRSPTAYPDPAEVTLIEELHRHQPTVATTELPTPVSGVNSTPVNVPFVSPIPAEVSVRTSFKPSGPPTDTILPLFAPCLISLQQQMLWLYRQSKLFVS